MSILLTKKVNINILSKLTIWILYYLNFFLCQPIEFIDKLVNVFFQIMGFGLFIHVLQVILVFRDGNNTSQKL